MCEVITKTTETASQSSAEHARKAVVGRYLAHEMAAAKVIRATGDVRLWAVTTRPRLAASHARSRMEYCVTNRGDTRLMGVACLSEANQNFDLEVRRTPAAPTATPAAATTTQTNDAEMRRCVYFTEGVAVHVWHVDVDSLPETMTLEEIQASGMEHQIDLDDAFWEG
jgi:hypothetical protein